MTNKQKFEVYFADLKASAKREGYTVSKRDEWARWIEKHKSAPLDADLETCYAIWRS